MLRNKSNKKISPFLIIFIIIIIFFFGFFSGKNYAFKSTTLSVLKSSPPDFNEKMFWDVWSTIKKDYVNQPVDDKELFFGAMEGLVMGLEDPYSAFLKPELAKEFLENMSGSFEGVGMEVGIKDNQLTVISPLPYTPAFRAGLKAGDKIFAIDGEETANMTLDEAVHLIRGPKGTEVVLTIWRPGKTTTEEISVVRDVIDIKTVSWELKEDQIAYLEITHFSEDTWKDFKNTAQVIIRANPKALILDLRNNPGGYLDTAVNMTGYWIGDQVAVISKNAQGEETKYQPSGSGEFKNIPTIVLVNQGSASASEILAGALQDYNYATILGEQTFGKGSVQELRSLTNDAALKLTVGNWYTPLGRSINKEGIKPDIEVELTEEDYQQDKDPQLERAISILKSGELK